jgi:hypothetical protein
MTLREDGGIDFQAPATLTSITISLDSLVPLMQSSLRGGALCCVPEGLRVSKRYERHGSLIAVLFCCYVGFLLLTLAAAATWWP